MPLDLESRIEVVEDLIINDPDSGSLMLEREAAYLAAAVAAEKVQADREGREPKKIDEDKWKAAYLASLPRLYAVILKKAKEVK